MLELTRAGWIIIGFLIIGALIPAYAEWYFLNILTNFGAIIEMFKWIEWMTKEGSIITVCILAIIFVLKFGKKQS